mgnify:CR=1 FL=1
MLTNTEDAELLYRHNRIGANSIGMIRKCAVNNNTVSYGL